MKLSSRLVLIIGSALIGLLLIAGIALQIIRSTMEAERENQTRTLLNLSVGILKHFHEMETSGKLPREEAQARASQALQGLKHENDYVFARMLMNQCHRFNYKAVIALQGDQGLSYASKYKPYAIILDLRLPVIDGWTVLKRLKENVELKRIPVHIISSVDKSL